MRVSLIGQTGVQFVKGTFPHREDDLNKYGFKYFEYEDENTLLLQAHRLLEVPGMPSESPYFKVLDLVNPRIISSGFQDLVAAHKKPALSGLIENKQIESVQEEVVESVRLTASDLKKFQAMWIPIPLVESMNNGEFNRQVSSISARVWFEIRPSQEEGKDDHVHAVFAVNTDDFNGGSTPVRFAIGSAPEFIDGFMSEDWANYLHGVFIPKVKRHMTREELQGLDDAIDNLGGKWHAKFQALLDWLSDRIKLDLNFMEHPVQSRAVSAFIDFGNDSTSVLLVDEQEGGRTDRPLPKVQELELFDFGAPLSSAEGPFETNCAFREPRLLREDLQGSGAMNDMRWLSPLCVGAEAQRLLVAERLNKPADLRQVGLEAPKRFLWDGAPTSKEWYFASLDGEAQRPVESVGVTDRMAANGQYISPQARSDEELNAERRYSRQSISTFLFLELCCQIHRQINSHSFREAHGDATTLRTLNRVVISCPTAMSKLEQVALRKACETAIQICTENLALYTMDLFEGGAHALPAVYPSSKELARPDDQIADRVEWGMDEATLSQLVWLYAESVQKRKSNTKQLLSDYGANGPLRIASIDLGGGTLDLMVCDHHLTSSRGIAEVRPDPVFWETIYKAGDDLLGHVIKTLLLRNSDDFPSLEKFMIDKNVKGYSGLIDDFFGDSPVQQKSVDKSRRHFLFKSLFRPMAKQLLEDANSNEVKHYKASDWLDNDVIDSRELSSYFLGKFGINLWEVEWVSVPSRTNQVAVEFYKQQIDFLARISNVVKPHVVLLTGGGFKSNALERAMVRACDLPLSRIVNLNHYILGKWYPYVNERGRLNHSKSIVSVGVAIADLANRHMLAGFYVNVDALITKIQNDELNFYLRQNGEPVKVMTQDQDEAELQINVANIPMQIETSPVDAPQYPKRHSYRLQFDDSYIKRQVRRRHPTYQQSEIDSAVDERKNEIRRFGELNLRIERNQNDREQIQVKEVEQNQEVNGRAPQSREFILHFESLPNGAIWMEHGIKF